MALPIGKSRTLQLARTSCIRDTAVRIL